MHPILTVKARRLVVAIAVASFALPAGASIAAAVNSGTPAASKTPYFVAALDNPNPAPGGLPEFVSSNLTSGRVDPTSIRLLGTTDDAQYYAGRSLDRNEVCHIVVVGHTARNYHAAASCASVDVFQQHGLPVIVASGSLPPSVSTLLPDTVNPDAAAVSGEEVQVGLSAPNLVVLRVNPASLARPTTVPSEKALHVGAKLTVGGVQGAPSLTVDF